MGNSFEEQEELKKIRKKIFIAGYKGGMAHLASCYSSLEMIYALYLKDILRYNPNNAGWSDRDRFILSKGHAGLALYAVLQRAGLISEDTYFSYLQENSLIGGEPCTRDCEWIEASTGSLGHGLSMGLGVAIAQKMNHSSGKVYVMLGDGECEEGSVWEAAISAPSFKVDNLIVILDCNRIQKMDFVDNIIVRADWKEKWEAFGWKVDEVDGHDMSAFKDVILGKHCDGCPRLVIAHTVKGKGVSIMENNPNWHFKLPNRKELKIFMDELNISDSELE
jgi:transketolase